MDARSSAYRSRSTRQLPAALRSSSTSRGSPIDGQHVRVDLEGTVARRSASPATAAACRRAPRRGRATGQSSRGGSATGRPLPDDDPCEGADRVNGDVERRPVTALDEQLVHLVGDRVEGPRGDDREGAGRRVARSSSAPSTAYSVRWAELAEDRVPAPSSGRQARDRREREDHGRPDDHGDRGGELRARGRRGVAGHARMVGLCSDRTGQCAIFDSTARLHTFLTRIRVLDYCNRDMSTTRPYESPLRAEQMEQTRLRILRGCHGGARRPDDRGGDDPAGRPPRTRLVENRLPLFPDERGALRRLGRVGGRELEDPPPLLPGEGRPLPEFALELYRSYDESEPLVKAMLNSKAARTVRRAHPAHGDSERSSGR